MGRYSDEKELEAFHAYEQDDYLVNVHVRGFLQIKRACITYSSPAPGRQQRKSRLSWTRKVPHHVLDAFGKADGLRANRDFQSTTTR
jgi:hypothetical protein